jgi:hypothetical protein
MVKKHEEWMQMNPCRLKHAALEVDDDSPGNATFIREILELTPRSRPGYPLLPKKVLSCGDPTGDHLTIAQVRRLAIELRKLRTTLQDFRSRRREAHPSHNHPTRKTDSDFSQNQGAGGPFSPTM